MSSARHVQWSIWIQKHEHKDVNARTQEREITNESTNLPKHIINSSTWRSHKQKQLLKQVKAQTQVR